MKWVVWASVLCVAAAQEVPLTIGGTVVSAQNGAPQGGVWVALTSSEARGKELGAVRTKADGRFAFQVTKGQYSLSAERSDLGRQPYGIRRLGAGAGVAIIADGTADYSQLQFRVHTPGAIRGRVLDQAGDPVERALVQLLQVWYNGTRRTFSRAYFYTDDRGMYRFGQLPVGEYYLVVGGTPWHSASQYGATVTQAFAPVYYPNTSDPKGAGTLQVKAGEEMVADFTLHEQPGQTVSVEVQGDGRNGSRITLTAEGVEGLNRFQFVQDPSYGPVLIPGVPQGSYLVTATGQSNGRRVAGSSKVVVTGQAPAAVSIALVPAGSVSGKVLCDGTPAGPGSDATVYLTQTEVSAGNTRRVLPDGTFQVPGAAAGPNKLMMTAGTECVLRRVLWNGVELKENMIHLETADLTGVVFEGTRKLGDVRGFVRNGERKEAGTMVYLAPVADSAHLPDYRSFMSDSDGSFHFRYVPQGDYWLFAVDKDDFEFANRKVIAPYLKRAERVTVSPADLTTRDIQLQ